MSALEAFNSIPPVTKYFIILSALTPLIMKIGLIPASMLVYHWPSIRYKFELWRLFTPFFITRTSLSYIFSVYFRFQYSLQLESVHFRGESGNYFYFLLISGFLLSIVNIYFQMAGMWENMSLVVIYLWAQYNRSTPVSFLFGLRFPAIYLPIVTAVFDFISDGNFVGSLCGIGVGHFWYVLSEVYAARNPRIRKYIEAPQFLQKLMDPPKPRTAPASAGGIRNSADGVRKRDPFQGRGHTLGG